MTNQSIELIQQQNAVFTALLINFTELSIIGIIGGFISYILEFYLKLFKSKDAKFKFELLILHGLLGGFASFIVLSMFPIHNVQTLIGVSAIAGLSSVTLLTSIKSVGLNYLLDKMFGTHVTKHDDDKPTDNDEANDTKN